MEINETATYAGASVEDVYGIISDQEFRAETCAAQGATDYDVTVEANAEGGDTVTVIRTMPTDMPAFIKSLTGDTVKVKQSEVWSGVDSSGNRNCDVKVNIIGQPAEMNGSVVLKAAGDDTIFDFNGDVKVKMPFIGKKIEPEIAKAILKSLRVEAELGNKRFS